MDAPTTHTPFKTAAVAAALILPPAAGAADEAPGLGRRCGEYCLRVALPALNFTPEETAAAVDRLGVPPAGGHAAADLLAAAEAAGGRAVAVKTTLPALKSRQGLGEPFACVLHLDGDHYALLSEVADDGSARLVDPPRSYSLPPRTLAARWDGTALLVSRDELTAEADLPGPFPWFAAALAAAGGLGLLIAGGVWLARREPAAPKRFTGPVSAAGLALLAAGLAGCGAAEADPAAGPVAAADGPPRAVFQTRREEAVIPVAAGAAGRHVFAFPVTNRGGAPLTISGLRTSCGCTAAGVTDDELAPGETAEVRATVNPQHPERREATVTVLTNTPDEPTTTLTVAWEAVAPLSPDPPEVDFGDVRPGEAAERRVRLVRHAAAGDAAGRPASAAATPADALHATLDGETIIVRLTAPAAFGPGSGNVTVALAGDGNGAGRTLRIPARFTVRDVLEATPPRIFLGAGPAEEVREGRTVLVSDRPVEWAGEPRVRPAGGGAGWSPTATLTPLTDRRALLTLRGPLPAAAGRHAATVTVAAAGPRAAARELAVPVSAFVTAAD